MISGLRESASNSDQQVEVAQVKANVLRGARGQYGVSVGPQGF
jgi:hypothetical protein